jgi:LPXTG-motif cell wall-anchored protein
MDEYHLGNKTKKNEIIDLAIEHHLMTKFTSFVSVENQIVNPRSDLLAVAIPTDLPHGWNYDAIFGSPKIIPATFATNGNNGVQLASARTITLPQTGTNYPLIFLLGLLLLVIGTVLRLVGNMNQK